MVTVVYIAGYGRSGSTVLDLVLGSAEGAFSVGELTNLPQAGWINREYCACGNEVNECPIWSGVREEWTRRTNSTPEQLILAQFELEKFRYSSRSTLGFGRNRMRAYSDLVGPLYEVISEVSGASVIVDASKNPLRALSLARIPSIDLRVIHLVRDVRGVAWSLMKQFRKDMESGVQRDIPARSPLRSSLSWSRSNLLAELALKRATRDKSTRVRYEDFVSNPTTTLARIGEATEMNLHNVMDRLEKGEEIPFAHTVAGNRVRMSGAVRLKPDLEWRQSMDVARQRWLWALVSPLMRRYGYTL